MPPACPCCRTSRNPSAGFARAARRSTPTRESYSQRQYYLAAQADEVYLDPMGYILIEGFGYFRTYYRGTLDKLAVDINVFKAGTHKSAPEEWSRADMSPEDRADAEVWVGALWDAYKADVGAARKLDPALIQAYADEAAAGIRATGGDVAQYALARGLVDGLKTRQEFEAIIAEVAGEDEETGFAAVDWQGYLPLRALRGLAAPPRRQDRGRRGRFRRDPGRRAGARPRRRRFTGTAAARGAQRRRTSPPSSSGSTARAAASWPPR